MSKQMLGQDFCMTALGRFATDTVRPEAALQSSFTTSNFLLKMYMFGLRPRPHWSYSMHNRISPRGGAL